jgi:hypothetical protein
MNRLPESGSGSRRGALPESRLDPDTLRAYRETLYEVRSRPATILRVDNKSAGLKALHKKFDVYCSAFITAYNPYSTLVSAAENVRRQNALHAELIQLGISFIDGIGRHPSNRWPAEPSFLVLGISLEWAKVMGMRHEQNAILWAGEDAVSHLIIL